MHHRSPFLFALAAAVLLSAPGRAAEGWIDLFNGRNLDGWEQHSGTAKYRVENGCVVGQTVANTINSFLCTKKTYGDFILEFEFNVAKDMNSGVQFRSQFYARETETEIKGKKRKLPADRVFGYQYEIVDPSVHTNTGGVYDEARRGWLVELKDNEPASKAFKPGWNKARIECKGDHIQTWINDVKAADFKDDMTLKGIIALQVHGIGDGTMKKPGEEIRWRNLRLKEL